MNRSISVLLSGLLLLALILPACGKSKPNEPGEAAASGLPTASSVSSPAPGNDKPAARQVTDSAGRQVEIPANPQRIASLEFTGYLWALGVKPVGTAPRYFVEPFKAEMEGVEDLGYPASPEKLIALDPDLIIAADYITPEQIQAYEKIAPLYLVSWSESDSFKRLSTLAELLDRQAAEEKWLQEYNGLVEKTRSQLAPYMEEGETASVFYTWGDTIRVLAPGVIPTLFSGIGFEPADKMKQLLSADPDYAGDNISQEVFPEYTADRIFIISADNKGQELADNLKKGGAGSLPAFRNNKVYLLNANWYSYEPLLLEWQLEDAVKVLTP